jgi:hypothetical protein
MVNTHRIVRAGAFVTDINAACIEAMKILARQMDESDHAALLAQLARIDVQCRMAREMTTDSMKFLLVEDAKAMDKANAI